MNLITIMRVQDIDTNQVDTNCICRNILDLLAEINLTQTVYIVAKQVFDSQIILDMAKKHTNLIAFYGELDDYSRNLLVKFIENGVTENENPFGDTFGKPDTCGNPDDETPEFWFGGK